jgi:ribosomal protein L37E
MSKHYVQSARRMFAVQFRCRHCKRTKPMDNFDLVYGLAGRIVHDYVRRACGGSGRRRVIRPTTKRCAACGHVINTDRSYLWTPAGFIHQLCAR